MSLAYGIKKFLATLTFLVVGLCYAEAQMSAGVPVFVDIELESGAITVPSFASESDITNGLETSVVRFKIKANNDWKVDTQIGTIVSTPIPNGPSTILHPLTYSNFSYIVSPNQNDIYNAPVAFSNALVTVLTGTKTGTDKKFSIKFKITPGMSVDPAAYTIPIIYTISPE
ncbi:MAG: hypothetical protein WBJ10_14910 [Daejeonella sp.]|uniref:hypothetical protein n=1 Tax=Daejeonella sp. TaxID=2805397 RepID=UPI003C7610C6